MRNYDAGMGRSSKATRSKSAKSAKSSKKKIPERELQVLALVARENAENGPKAETNGRELAAQFEKERKADIPYGTLYTILDAMEQNGWVKSRKTKLEGRWTRWFRMTVRGDKALEEARQYYRDLAEFAKPRKGKRSSA